MPLKKFFLFIAIIATISSSETINISGAVVDSSGRGIAGAEVLLERANLSTKTNENGLFTLTGTPTGAASGKSLSAGATNGVPFIENGRLNFTLHIESAVTVTTYSLQGRVVYRANKMMRVGTHALAMPVPGDGVYLCRVKIGSREYCVKGTFVRNTTGRVYGSSVVRLDGPAKLAKVVAAIDDVIAARKDGWLHYRCIIGNSDTSGIVIKMIANAGDLIDIDGNVYQTVRIGDQVWMTENLRTTHLNNGYSIPYGADSVEWGAGTPRYCYYNNTTNSESMKKFGALYNWHTVKTGKLAPAGWHVPTRQEVTDLGEYMAGNGYNWDGTRDKWQSKIGKSLAAQMDWHSDTTVGTIGCGLPKNNSSGFSALPGGSRDGGCYYPDDPCGNFKGHGLKSNWWTATGISARSSIYYAAYYYTLSYDSERFGYTGIMATGYGYSVRLVRD